MRLYSWSVQVMIGTTNPLPRGSQYYLGLQDTATTQALTTLLHLCFVSMIYCVNLMSARQPSIASLVGVVGALPGCQGDGF